jgi:hypothetical protein
VGRFERRELALQYPGMMAGIALLRLQRLNGATMLGVSLVGAFARLGQFFLSPGHRAAFAIDLQQCPLFRCA